MHPEGSKGAQGEFSIVSLMLLYWNPGGSLFILFLLAFEFIIAILKIAYTDISGMDLCVILFITSDCVFETSIIQDGSVNINIPSTISSTNNSEQNLCYDFCKFVDTTKWSQRTNVIQNGW